MLLSSIFTKITEKTNKSWRLYNFFSKILPTPIQYVRNIPIKIMIPLHQEGVWNTCKKWETREIETLDWIDSFNEVGTFFDIGASFGNETLYAALKSNCSRKIFAFDIDLLSSYNLACNIALNNIKNVTQFFLPLGKSNTIVQANEPTQYIALSQQGIRKIQYNLFAISLDEFIDKTKEIPRYIKIDVDGAEVNVLHGMEKILKNPQLKSILIEVSSETEADVTSILTNAKFKQILHTKYQQNPNTSNIIFSR